MRPLCIVERNVALDGRFRFRDAVVGMQIDLFVLERLPESLHEDVVAPAALPIHAQRNAMRLANEANECGIGELAALVSVEDLRYAVQGDCLFQRGDAKVRRHSVGDAPSEHPARRPIENGAQIQKASAHRDIRYIGRPDMVGLMDDQVTQQIREDWMFGVTSAGDPLAIQRLNAHASHQRPHVPTTNSITSCPQQIAQHAGSGKGILLMQPVDLAHQLQIQLADGHWL